MPTLLGYRPGRRPQGVKKGVQKGAQNGVILGSFWGIWGHLGQYGPKTPVLGGFWGFPGPYGPKGAILGYFGSKGPFWGLGGRVPDEDLGPSGQKGPKGPFWGLGPKGVRVYPCFRSQSGASRPEKGGFWAFLGYLGPFGARRPTLNVLRLG